MPVAVRPLTIDQLDEAEQVFRLAFGTFLGLREPLQFTGDCAYVRTRWLADPSAAWAAHLDDTLAGSNFATRWGSFAFFGPLSVRPEWWERGIARHLLDATMQRFEEWGVGHTGLYTFAQSPKHVALYQRYGFFPRFLTAIASKNVVAAAGAVTPDECRSALISAHRAATLRECADLTDAIFAGLDVAREIDAVQEQALGDTLLLRDDDALRGFAVCHLGPGTEAGGGVCYVKFAAVAPGAPGGRALRTSSRPVRALRRAARRRPDRRRRQHRPSSGVPGAARARLPELRPGRRHAAPERPGLQPPGCVDPRRLAIAAPPLPPPTFYAVRPRAAKGGPCPLGARSAPRRGAVTPTSATVASILCAALRAAAGTEARAPLTHATSVEIACRIRPRAVPDPTCPSPWSPSPMCAPSARRPRMTSGAARPPSSSSPRNRSRSLFGLEEFSHAEVIFHFHRGSAKIVRGARRPRAIRMAALGIFAQRGKNRPNRLGTTIARIMAATAGR